MDSDLASTMPAISRSWSIGYNFIMSLAPSRDGSGPVSVPACCTACCMAGLSGHVFLGHARGCAGGGVDPLGSTSLAGSLSLLTSCEDVLKLLEDILGVIVEFDHWDGRRWPWYGCCDWSWRCRSVDWNWVPVKTSLSLSPPFARTLGRSSAVAWVRPGSTGLMVAMMMLCRLSTVSIAVILSLTAWRALMALSHPWECRATTGAAMLNPSASGLVSVSLGPLPMRRSAALVMLALACVALDATTCRQNQDIINMIRITAMETTIAIHTDGA